jgi:ketosteroid isomerase-like protein
MNNIARIKKAYQDFAKGNVEAALSVFDPNVIWDECTGFPFVTGDGIFKGIEAIDQGIFMKMPEYYDSFKFEIDEVIEAGNKIIMQGHYIGKWALSGKEFKANAVHIWTLKDGKAIHMFEAADTAEIVF